MKKALKFALAFSCLALVPSPSSFAQDNASRTPASVAAESSNREADRLNGPVRRVRVETAKITVKDGNWVELPREVLGIATYDPTGRKIDSVAYPVEGSTLQGKEQYLHDDKGNVVEMILRSTDGSMLSKEAYKYEFDQLGNWTKMSSSVAVYEDGKISFEPTGITYRTISYYYNQAIEKLNAASPKSKEVSAPSTSSTLLPKSNRSSTDSPRSSTPTAQVSTIQPLSEAANAHAKKEPVTAPPPASVAPAKSGTAAPDGPVATSSKVRTTSTLLQNSNRSSTDSPSSSTPTTQVNTTIQPLSEAVSAHAKNEPVTAPASVAPAKSGTAAADGPIATSSETGTTPDNAPATNVVQHVAEDVLRNAAIELPKPEYSDAALLARASGKVKVQILVDENGHVMNAQATSGHPLLGAAAEAAARKARFSLTKASSGATKVYGMISYEFVPPTPASEAFPGTSPTIDRNPPKTDDHKPEATPIPDESFVESKPKASANYSEAAKSFYNKGVTFQASGRYAEAAEAFNEAIKVDPNDANAYARLGMAYSAIQKHKDAIAVYKIALQTDRSVLGAPAYYMWGHSYLALEKTSDALLAFKQALYIMRAQTIDPERKETQRYPSLEQLHYGMGIAYLKSRRFATSIDELKQVVALNPKNAEAHYALAIAHLSNGNRREAEIQQRTLRLLDPALAQKITSALSGAPKPPSCLNFACR